MLNATRIPLVKTYVVDGQSYYYRSASRPGAPMKDPCRFSTGSRTKRSPAWACRCPRHRARVSGHSSGGVLYAGEDRITHAKDELVSLHTGNAFDIVAERKQMTSGRWEAISTRWVRDCCAITRPRPSRSGQRAHRRRLADAQLSYPATKTAAFAAQFNIPVAKDGTSVLRYRVRVHW